MSGGVDSSVAAYLLKKQGYDVVGIFLKLWNSPHHDACGARKQNLCCDDKAMNAARQIAGSLKIPFYVYNVDNLFKEKIVDDFISEYEAGRTPNPCVRCNRYIKFGYLWDVARHLKADYLATGHYIRVSNYPECHPNVPNAKAKAKTARKEFGKLGADSGTFGNISIMRGHDTAKDQTYFLSTIDSSVIPHLLFPLGDMTKKEVREIAKKAKISVYNKKDSMGVCFIPDGDTEAFLSFYTKKLKKPGSIVDKRGNVLGKHQGLLGYTIGQKIGDDVVTKSYLTQEALCFPPSPNLRRGTSGGQPERVRLNVPRLYVTSIDAKKNRLTIGENQDCFTDTMMIENINILDDRFWEMVKNNETFYVQIRGGHKAEKCTVSVGANGCSPDKKGACHAPLRVRVQFKKPVRAVTPGQVAAVFKKDVLIGGGTIK